MILSSEEGFDKTFCSGGMWGKGLYFAENASYSNNYAFKGNNSLTFFLAEFILGEKKVLPSDYTLTAPPVNPSTKKQYDSVQGMTGGSDVYMLYSN